MGRPVLAAALALPLAVLSIACGATSTTSVAPTPVKCEIGLSSSPNLPSSGGPGRVTVTTTPECAWTASENLTWISQLSPASGQGSGEIGFQATANTASVSRQGDVTVGDATVEIQQNAASCTFQLGSTSISVAATAGQQSLSVTSPSGCGWTAVSGASWITVASGAFGNGSGSVTFDVAENTGAARNGTLTVAGQTFTVNQAGACSYSITPTSQSIGANGGNGSTTMTTGSQCAWSIVSNASWISFNGSANRTGGATVNFSSAANTGPARQGTLSLADKTFTISQASGCVFSINPTSRTHNAAAGAGTVAVTAGTGCAWTAVSNVSWITVVTGASGSGNGTVSYTVAVKPLTPPGNRVGTVTIAGLTFTVTQTP